MSKKPTYEELEQRVKELEKKATDITEVKKFQGALRKEKDFVESLINTAQLITLVLDTEGLIVRFNPYMENLSGYRLEEVKGRDWFSTFLPEQDYDRIRALFRKAVSDIQTQGNINPITAKDGREIIVQWYDKTLKDADGNIIGLLAIGQDITERKQAEKALRESEEKYRILVENANDAIFVAQDEVIKFPNPKTEDITGYSKEELVKIPFSDLIHPEDKDTVLDRHRKRLSGEELPGTYSFRIVNKTGEELWMQLNTVSIDWEGRQATLNFLRDITQQRKLEAQVQYAQRMESLGTLAGGIAHDFNNLLMGIQGNASLMLIERGSGNPDYEKLKNIEQYVQNGADLTKQLLGFARGGKYEVKPTDLSEIIKSQNRMFGRTKKEITVRGKYEENLWAVEVDQGQIQQVLLNIYVNAWQAMPGGGDLDIQTENIMLDEDYVKPFNLEPGRYVKISVTDTGIGMDEATQQRIFDPFFTTKEMGRGTGLGLASVYGIIKNHGGFINVYSKKLEGTTFKIYLPATETKQIDSGAKRDNGDIQSTIPPGRRPLGAGGDNQQSTVKRILLVDDEAMIIDVGKQLLEKLGYEVLLARSGQEAIDIYKENRDRIDMVILDMVMPEMSGSETYDRLKEINPDIKVLLSSGYSIKGQATEILERGCDGFIQKPFNMKQFSGTLREIFDKE